MKDRPLGVADMKALAVLREASPRELTVKDIAERCFPDDFKHGDDGERTTMRMGMRLRDLRRAEPPLVKRAHREIAGRDKTVPHFSITSVGIRALEEAERKKAAEESQGQGARVACRG